jgi:3',5'-cyclic-AMP phosphodiesterase
MIEHPTRREWLKLGLAGAGALTLAPTGLLAAARTGTNLPRAARSRVVRLAHLTDTHVQPERAGFDGLVACLRHAAAQPDRPELLLTGGDLIMDSFDAVEARTRLQWDLWTKAFKDECPIQVEHCLGNHDIWGWNKSKSKTTGHEDQWGKKWALDVLGLASPYRTLDRGQWRIIVLDSVQPAPPPDGSGYIGKLGDEQMAWLDGELSAANGKHVLVLSHIPILSVSALAFDSEVDDKNWTLPGSNMMIDARTIIKLFRKHGNVKLCLSGHIHLLDRCEYEGVTYICGGAVSGAWWKGKQDRCDEGYGLVNLYDDGTFDYDYTKYGWVAKG